LRSHHSSQNIIRAGAFQDGLEKAAPPLGPDAAVPEAVFPLFGNTPGVMPGIDRLGATLLCVANRELYGMMVGTFDVGDLAFCGCLGGGGTFPTTIKMGSLIVIG